MTGSSLLDNDSSPLAVAQDVLWWRAITSLLLAGIVCALLSISGYSNSIDDRLHVFRDSLVDRQATGDIQLVEIDGRSLAELSQWPWPRKIHGELVDRLKAAGADTIAFDVDFSSASTPENDEAFARALARFDGTAILPAFRQYSGAGSDTVIESEPIAILRDSAMLASVNVFPDSDGVIRRYSFGTSTSSVPRPSMPALLAQSAGDIGDQFWLSNSIQPSTIPRHSAVDILNGNFKNADIRGKTVLIGATALEFGDRYATQRFGILPGVVIQALAAETLLQQLVLPEIGALPMLAVGLLFSLAMLLTKRSTLGNIAASLGVASILLVPFFLEYGRIASLASAAALIFLTAAYCVMGVFNVLHRFWLLRYFDVESGLPNMRSLEKALVGRAQGVLAVLKISNFGELQSLLGGTSRAELTRAITDRIRPILVDDFAYLTSEGQIAWILPDYSLEEACDAADGIASLFVAPLTVANRLVTVSPAIGLACIEAAGGSIDNARLASDQAASRRTKWLAYSKLLSADSDFAQIVLTSLDLGMRNGHIHFAYQPKYCLANNRYKGAEALMRWRHPELGLISPDQFIPVLEQNGRMAEVTLFAFKSTEQILRRWHWSKQDLNMAVNLSASLLSDKKFSGALNEWLSQLGPASKLLTIEITESAATTHDTDMVDWLNSIRAVGCRVSIDDYGTGNSTLAYLKNFPADEIKIDKSFVTNLTDSRSDQALVRSTVALAHELGLSVVAEGVETQECAALLTEMGCDIAQGWHFGKPLSLVHLEELFGRQLLDRVA